MNMRFVISVVVLLVWTLAMGFLVHGVLLGSEYAALPGLMRAPEEAQNYFLWMIIGNLSLAIGITWVYRMGKEDKPWLEQGIRFGIALVFLMTTSIYLIYYAVQPVPVSLMQKQVLYDAVAMLLTGVVTAFVNK